MILDVETEDNLIQLGLLDSNTLVAKRWGKLPQKVRQSQCSHVNLTHGIVLCPSILEGFDVLFLQR